ncbi:zinc finger, CCHC-type containing LTR copia-type gag-polypeptide [Tanacetum coccineum]
MAASSSFHDSLFSMNTLLHMITIKLSSTNYLLWRNHMIPIFTYQKLIGHINGTSISPSPKVTIEGKANPNPDLLTWTEDDQRAVILLQSSLTEEAAAEVLGLTTAHQIWLSLEAAYSNASVERIHLLRDSLRQLKKESHELFLQSLHGTPTPPAVFHVETTNTDSAQGGGRSNHGNHSRGRGRGHNRRPPHCQLCLTNGHYATTCPSLYTYATQASPSLDESLAKAFHAQCHVNTNTPNWHVDSGATDHMTPAYNSLHHSSPYPDIPLRIVLVIPKLNKKLLSALTHTHPPQPTTGGVSELSSAVGPVCGARFSSGVRVGVAWWWGLWEVAMGWDTSLTFGGPLHRCVAHHRGVSVGVCAVGGGWEQARCVGASGIGVAAGQREGAYGGVGGGGGGMAIGFRAPPTISRGVGGGRVEMGPHHPGGGRQVLLPGGSNWKTVSVFGVDGQFWGSDILTGGLFGLGVGPFGHGYAVSSLMDTSYWSSE